VDRRQQRQPKLRPRQQRIDINDLTHRGASQRFKLSHRITEGAESLRAQRGTEHHCGTQRQTD
jgi:hypothetical protein